MLTPPTFTQRLGLVPYTCATCRQRMRAWPPGVCAWCGGALDAVGYPRSLLRVVYREPRAIERFTADQTHRLERGWVARFAEFGTVPVNPWLAWLLGPLAWLPVLRTRCLTVTYTREGLHWPPLVLVPRDVPESDRTDPPAEGDDAAPQA